MDKTQYHCYCMQLIFEQNGIKVTNLSKTETDYTVKFYIQKETGKYYQYGHYYKMFIVTYKNNLPTNLHLNNWILPVTMCVNFANMGHFSEVGKPELFIYEFYELNICDDGKIRKIKHNIEDYGDARYRLSDTTLANIFFNELYSLSK